MAFIKLCSQAILSFLILSIILGVIYPLVITGFGQLFFRFEANGSLIEKDGKIIGSKLIGQAFPKNYFQSRPSASNYDVMKSGGSNYAVNNPKQIELVKKRIKEFQKLHGTDKKVPADLVFASGSGLDFQITFDAAQYQAPYIAKLRNIELSDLNNLIESIAKHPDRKPGQAPVFGFFGIQKVNVLELNLKLDELTKEKSLK